MERSKPQLRRCAVYTRKSSEEDLEQEFNSLHAQREACDAFIKSQAGEGWRLVRTQYDDGGLSGATMERPALQRLMADIDNRLVDAVVVYKVDRLTRSLADFAKMVEVFDARGVSFVAVTQQFNTTTSMGRLTLNVLLSFAQFEREVTGERIRDKIAASKRKGIWMGGLVPLGYEVRERQLVINQAEAESVRDIFARYAELGSVRLLKEELDRSGVRSKVRVSQYGVESGGQMFSRGALYTLLRNPIYVGEIRHKGVCHPGQHAPIVDRVMWDKAVQLLHEHGTASGARNSSATSGVLIGKLFDESGEGLTPSHAVKGDRRYRYYVSRSLMKGNAAQVDCGWRLPAAEIERSVAAAVRSILDDQQTVVAAIEETGLDSNRIARLLKSAAAWNARLQFEQDDALSALIDRVDLDQEGMRLSLKLPLASAASGAPDGSRHLSIKRHVPMQIRRRGVELRLVINGGASTSGKTDQALLKAVARAHCWFDDLVRGRSMVQIAKSNGVGKQYVSRLMRLAFLAPEIVERMVAGRQPPGLTAQALRTGRFDIPMVWAAQKRALGFAQLA
jgi:DNA invertase Pin-like site-specific DNA recombinase